MNATVLHNDPIRLLLAAITRLVVLALCLAPLGTLVAADGGFSLQRSLAIGGEGRWDYIITDGARLFVPRSSHTMILDAATGAVLGDIPGTAGVHGVALMPALGRGYASDGADGTVTVFSLSTYQVLGRLATAPGADCIIADPSTNQVLAFCGAAGAMVAIPADCSFSAPLGQAFPPLALGGKPEYAAADGAGMVYANLEDTSEVVAIDARSRTVVARHPLAPGQEPTGMAIDAVHRRLFIGCHNRLLIVMDADSGAVIAHLPIGAGVDATAYRDPLAFASCGDGTLTVVRENSTQDFAVVQQLTTKPGARTMAVDAKSGTIYLPTAAFGATPAATADHPHPRPPMIPGSFQILVVVPPPPATPGKP